jgi:predicted dinucleotide-utilizing enzyme
MEGVSINIPLKNISRTAKFLGPSNTFDLNPKWQRTLLFIGNFSWDMHRFPPNANIKAVI